MRIAAALALLFLLLPLAGALPAPVAAPAAAPPWAVLRLHLAPDRAPALERASMTTEANSSECQLFSPLEFSCEGEEVYVGNTINISLGFDLESVSNTFVHIVQEVDDKPVFAWSCRTNFTAWVVLVAIRPECRTWGLPQFNTLTSVRMDVSHLPAAGDITVGGWHGRIGP